MNDLIKVNYEKSEQPTVSGRDLHAALEVQTPYHKWFPRMCEYGFAESNDYSVTDIFVPNSNGGRQTQIDHQLTIPMAKEICMLQRSEKGRQFRQYFIEIENRWNTPEAVMARALQFANQQLDKIKQQNLQLEQTVAVQTQQITEMRPKASYYDIVLSCPDLMSITKIAKDYGKTARWMNEWLHSNKVQFKQGNVWLLYDKYAKNGYTNTKTQTFQDDSGKTHVSVHTYWTQKGRLFLYDLLKSHGILPTMEKAE